MTVNIQNRQAKYNFFIKSTFEAGIVLSGIEVKSIRCGQISISDAYITEKNKEIFLHNAHIQQYKLAFYNKNQNYNPKQDRKLLLHKKEINKCLSYINKKGMTIIPISLYSNKRGIIKVQIGIAEGKKLHDKRADEKQKEWIKEKSKIEKVFGLK